MATLRDLIPGYTGPSTLDALTVRPTLRSPGLAFGPEVAQANDDAEAAGMGQARRGFVSGRLSAEANALASEEASARAAGQYDKANSLREQIRPLQERAAVFAPKEQDVTALNWEPERILDYGLGAAGQAVASTLEPIALGAGGNVAAAVASKLPYVKHVAGALRAAGLAAAYGQNVLQARGEAYNALQDDPALQLGSKSDAEINANLWGTGLASGALDTALPAAVAGRLVGRPAISALHKGGGVLRRTALDALGETATETAQQKIQQFGHTLLNPNRDTSGDTNELLNAAAGGFFGGVAIGGASNLASRGHARLDVKDDGNVGDVLTKDGKTTAAPKTDDPGERLVRSMAERVKEQRLPNAQEEGWRTTLSGTGPAASFEDAQANVVAQHAALVKELGARAEKGDGEAGKYLQALLSPEQDPTNPVAAADTSVRDAARDHLIGDGVSPDSDERLITAFKGRKLNEQGVRADDLVGRALKDGKPLLYSGGAKISAEDYKAEQQQIAQRAKLTATFMRDSIGPGRDNRLKGVATTIADEVAQFGSALFAKPDTGDLARVERLGRALVHLYGDKKAQAVVQEIGRTAAVQDTPLFAALAEHTARAADSRVAYSEQKVATRIDAATQLASVVPPEAELKLRKAGVDLTTEQGKLALLEQVQGSFHGDDVATAHPHSALVKAFGKDTVEKMRAIVGQRIEPGSKLVDESEIEQQSGATASVNDDGSALDDDAPDADPWDVKGALKNIEAAPGDRLYMSKGGRVTPGLGGHPFVKDKKTGNLPVLFDMKKGEDGKLQGEPYADVFPDGKPNPKAGIDMVQDHIAAMYEKGVGAFDAPWQKPASKNTSPLARPEPDIPPEKVKGSGSYRVRAVSAREVMDAHGVQPAKRVMLMRAYAEKMQAPKGVASLAERIGLENRPDETTIDLANRFFASKYLIEASQMAERDPLRMSRSELRRMAQRGAADLKKAEYDAKGDRAESLAIQADMNLIRFRSPIAPIDEEATPLGGKPIHKVVAIRVSELVRWVNENQPERSEEKGKSPLARARAYRERVMEGVSALVGEGLASEMPFMVNDQGKTETFKGVGPSMKRGTYSAQDLAQGLPPTLKLGTMTQKELRDAQKKRAERRKGKSLRVSVLSPEEFEAQSGVDAVDPNASAEERERQRAEITADTRDDIAQEFLYQGHLKEAPAEGLQGTLGLDPNAKPAARPALGPEGEQFWTGAETTDRRTDEVQTPLDAEPEQREGVPTDRTDVRNRTSALNAPMPGIERLTPTNVMQRGRALAEEILGLYASVRGQRVPEAKVTSITPAGRLERSPGTRYVAAQPARPAEANERLQRLARGLGDDPQYGAVLAMVLTPERVKGIVGAAGAPAAQQALLDGLRAQAARALLQRSIPPWVRVQAARLLTGNAELRGPAPVEKALQALAAPAIKETAAAAQRETTAMEERGRKQEAAATKRADEATRQGALPFESSPKLTARVDELASTENYSSIDTTAKVTAFLAAARARLAELEQARAAGDQKNLPGGQEKVLLNLRNLFSPSSDLAAFYTEAKDFDALPKNEQKALLDSVKPRQLNEQQGRPKLANVTLPGNGPYLAKDQRKADQATKFIGRGSPASSTARYAKAFGALANSGTYVAADRVFVSAEGARGARFDPDFTELKKAATAGATFITDDIFNRSRQYNVGERQVAEWLSANGYTETHPGTWTKPRKLNEQATPAGVQSPEAAARRFSPEELQAAKDYVRKVLGPKIRVEFGKEFDAAGEWLDVDNLIKLSTAIGPGVLTVAHHESMHALWSQLVKNHPAAAEALSNVMSDPKMQERLVALLDGSPKAQAKIAADPEERVAYAYQFWLAGALEVDKPADTIFAKVRRFLRMVLGMVRESETALDIMEAFSEGKLSEPSAAGVAIDRILKRATWNADVRLKFDKQLQAIYSAIAPSNDVLLNMGVAPATQLARMLFTNPGEEKAAEHGSGYLNERRVVTAQFTNYLYEAVQGLSDKDLVEVAKHMNEKTKLDEIAYAPVREAVKKSRALTKRYYDYAVKAGLRIGYLGDDHYPRVWSTAELAAKRDEFIAMLLKPRYAKAMQAWTDMYNKDRPATSQKTVQEIAQLAHKELMDKNGVADSELGLDGSVDRVLHGDQIYNPFFASAKERNFTWLDPKDVAPFLENDHIGTMTRYLHQGVRAAEFARKFGNGGERLKAIIAMPGEKFQGVSDSGEEKTVETGGSLYHALQAEAKKRDLAGKTADEWVARRMEDARNAVAAHEGSLGSDISDTWRRASSALMTYQNLRLLPMALFAAFGDTLGIASRGAGMKAAGDAFVQGLKDVYARWKDAASDTPAERKAGTRGTSTDRDFWEHIAAMVGAVDSHMFLEQMGKAHTSEFMTDLARKANRALFMANGLTAWDRSMRVSATKTAVLFLERHAGLPEEHSRRWLAELGVNKAALPLDADGKLIVDRHVLAATRTPADATQEEKAAILEQATQDVQRVHRAITRWVEGAIMSPNAAQRPSWSSDPHWAVLFHLKQFTYSFHHTILKRAFNEAQHGNMNPIGALAAAVPTMLVADITKSLILHGGSLPDYQQSWTLGDHVMKAVVRSGAGGVGQFGIDALRDPLQLLGPTVDQAASAALHPTEAGRNLKDAVPLVRMM